MKEYPLDVTYCVEFDGHSVYAITKKKIFIKKTESKVQFFFKVKGKIKILNFKFSIRPHRQWKYFHWLIRFPFFYWEKNNGGFEIGLPNFYLWVIK